MVGTLNVADSFNYLIGAIDTTFSVRRTGMSSATNIYVETNTPKLVFILLVGLQLRI